MAIPPISDPRWKDLLIGKEQKPVELLALKIMIGRLRLQVQQKPQDMSTALSELETMVKKVEKLAPKDITIMFGGRP